MKQGYYIVVPNFVSYMYPDYDVVCRCLSWLIKNFEPILNLCEQDFMFSVIPICYMGCYPGIGFNTEQPQQNASDLTILSFGLERAINAFLSKDALTRIVEASKDGPITWQEVCRQHNIDPDN